MEINDFLEEFDEKHFIYKIRYREFDKEAAIKFIEELKNIHHKEGDYISKILMQKFHLVLSILYNQTKFFATNLNDSEWQELNNVYNEIFYNLRRLLSVNAP